MCVFCCSFFFFFFWNLESINFTVMHSFKWFLKCLHTRFVLFLFCFLDLTSVDSICEWKFHAYDSTLHITLYRYTHTHTSTHVRTAHTRLRTDLFFFLLSSRLLFFLALFSRLFSFERKIDVFQSDFSDRFYRLITLGCENERSKGPLLLIFDDFIVFHFCFRSLLSIALWKSAKI